jgi:hypothetical protein
MSSEKAIKWNHEVYVHLLGAMAVALDATSGITANKDTIMNIMQAHGHTFTWEAIR